MARHDGEPKHMYQSREALDSLTALVELVYTYIWSNNFVQNIKQIKLYVSNMFVKVFWRKYIPLPHVQQRFFVTLHNI